MTAKQRPPKDDWLIEAESGSARPFSPRPGMRFPPPPGWEWRLIHMTDYLADLLEELVSYRKTDD